MKVFRNVLPLNLALAARDAYLDVSYDHVRQERKNHFAKDFDSHEPTMPQNSELYCTEFWRSNYLATTPLIQDLYNTHIRTIIESMAGSQFSHVDLRCYKLEAGGHYRIHVDDYVADYGFILYLSREWRWDWGGLLMTLDPDYQAQAEIPEFNKLVVMDHASGQSPHWVTPVAPWALEPRFTLVGFLRKDT